MKNLLVKSLIVLSFLSFSFQSVFAQQLTVNEGYIRATIPGTNVSSAYMTLKNTSDTAVTLVGATSEFSDRIEIHEHVMDEGMMRMRQRENLTIDAFRMQEAIKNNFFDYWVLPFDEFEICKSLVRFKKILSKVARPQTLCLKSYRDFHYLSTNDIVYLKADNNATEFIMRDGTINNAYKTLKVFEQQMPTNFVRIHQSYIVNSDYISGISYGRGLCSLKLGKLVLPFSKSYRSNIDELKNLLSKNTISSLN